jgi:hypothetical protein
MGRSIINSKFHFYCLAILLLLSATQPIYAAGLSLDYVLGFNGRFQIGRWTPISIMLENKGRAIRGTLEVVVTSGNEYRRDVYPHTYSMEVELPTNSKKRYTFTVLIKSVTHDLRMTLEQNGSILVSKAVNLRSYFTEKHIAVVAEDFASPAILTVMPERVETMGVQPKFLPDAWYGYDGVKLLVMKAETISGLRPRQYRALTGWLKQGGFLVTSGGLNYGALFSEKVQHILPVKIRGQIRLTELNSLAQFCSRSLSAKEPLLVLDARIDDSDAVVKENHTPLVIHKKFGLGHIIFLPFDYNVPPFSRWDGGGLFWDKILTMQASTAVLRSELDGQKIVGSMSADIAAHFQSLTSVSIFIGAYLGLLWYFFKRLKRSRDMRRKNGMLLCTAVIVFVAVGYWRFFYPNYTQKFTCNSFGQLSFYATNAPASLTYVIGLYALQKVNYRLELPAPSYPVTHIISNRSPHKIPNPYAVNENDSGQHIIGSLNKWSHSFYKITSSTDAPLIGHAERDDLQLTIAIENRLPDKVVDCLVYYQRRFVFVGDILSGARQNIRLNIADLKKTEISNELAIKQITQRFMGHQASSFLGNSQKYLSADVLRAVHDNYKLDFDSLVIIGWIQAGVFHPGINRDHVPGENLTLLKWVLPVEMIS